MGKRKRYSDLSNGFPKKKRKGNVDQSVIIGNSVAPDGKNIIQKQLKKREQRRKSRKRKKALAQELKKSKKQKSPKKFKKKELVEVQVISDDDDDSKIFRFFDPNEQESTDPEKQENRNQQKSKNQQKNRNQQEISNRNEHDHADNSEKENGRTFEFVFGDSDEEIEVHMEKTRPATTHGNFHEKSPVSKNSLSKDRYFFQPATNSKKVQKKSEKKRMHFKHGKFSFKWPTPKYGTICLVCGKQDHRTDMCPNRICCRCGEMGHTEFECVYGDDQPDCEWCGKVGHSVSSCPVKELVLSESQISNYKDPLSSKPGVFDFHPTVHRRSSCYNCGSNEHEGSECPYATLEDIYQQIPTEAFRDKLHMHFQQQCRY